MEGQVRTLKESELASDTHFLKSADREISQDTKTKQASKRLTLWRAQTERQVRTPKESEPERGTHFLKSADGQTIQDIKSKQEYDRIENKSEHENQINKDRLTIG